MELHLPPKPTPTVLPGEFRFAAAGLAHGHIYGMVNGLLDAGAELVGVWDEDLKKVSAFQSAFPQAHAASCLDELLDAPDIPLIVSAAVPSERCPLGLRVMAAGKDYFVDKSPHDHAGPVGRSPACRGGNRPEIYGLLFRTTAQRGCNACR